MAKRKQKVRKPKPKRPKRSTKLYPIIWCTGEELAIAVSKKVAHVKVDSTGKAKVRNKDKVNFSQWRDWNSTFREGYKIDLSQCEAGDIVKCPHCGSPVDFRVFPASRPPQLTEVAYDEKDTQADTEKLPDTPGQDI